MKHRFELLPTLLTVGLMIVGCRTAPEPPSVALPVVGTTWSLVELNGKPLVIAEDLKPPTLQLDAAKHRVNGMGGVNRFSGAFQLEAETLAFSQFITTRMAGSADAMVAEKSFLAALGEVSGWAVKGSTLSLSAGDRVVARFRANDPTVGAAP